MARSRWTRPAETTEVVGAANGERTADRSGHHAGCDRLSLVTRNSKLQWCSPRDRDGRFSSELFERDQRSE